MLTPFLLYLTGAICLPAGWVLHALIHPTQPREAAAYKAGYQRGYAAGEMAATHRAEFYHIHTEA